MELEQRAIYPVELEIRRGGGGGRGGGRGGGSGGGRSISGRFGLSRGGLTRKATVRNRGKVRKELLNRKAFSWSVRQVIKLKDDLDKLMKSNASKEIIEDATQELARRDIHILAGHDFNKPLGSVVAGSALVTAYDDEIEDDPRLEFNVDLPEDETAWPSYMTDTVRQIEAGLIGGISPGFSVPPKDVVPNAEEFIEEPGNPGVLIRKINEAVLVELSLVTRPAYTETEVDVRTEYAEQDYIRNYRIWL